MPTLPTMMVSDIVGDDASASRGGRPFKTIAAALAVAQAGDFCYIGVGTYTIPAGLVLPSGVALTGLNSAVTKIQMLNVTADTDLMTMGDGARVERIDFLLTSTGHHRLRGFVFPGTSAATAKVRDSTIKLDNSAASGAGSSDITGIHIAGTAQPAIETSCLRACSVVVDSAGGGAKDAILNDAAGRAHMRDINLSCRRAAGSSGVYTAARTNHANAYVRLDASILNGDDFDAYEELGTLDLGPGVTKYHAPPPPPGGGGGFTSIQMENKDVITLPAGTPVAAHTSGSGFIRADASNNNKNAIGITNEQINVGFSGEVLLTGPVTLADWTDITGTSNLAARGLYFLDTTAGMLTTTAPSSSGQAVQLVGKALAADTLEILVEPSVLL